MFSFFTELNRKRPPAELLDFVTHTTSPIVHAADDRLGDGDAGGASLSSSSRRKAIIGKTAYRVGPSAIPARQNPYGAASAANPNNERVCLSRDGSAPARPVRRRLDAGLSRAFCPGGA